MGTEVAPVKRKRTTRKVGRPAKIDDASKKTIYGILGVGGSLNDAADFIGIARSTLNLKAVHDPDFRKGIDRAIAAGKTRYINKIGTAVQWQAAAWMLERKWGSEFGKHERIEHSGPNGGPIQTETKQTFDYDAFRQSIVASRIAEVEGGAGSNGQGRLPPANGNGKSVHPVGAEPEAGDVSN